jgi:hypothetical protein
LIIQSSIIEPSSNPRQEGVKSLEVVYVGDSSLMVQALIAPDGWGCLLVLVGGGDQGEPRAGQDLESEVAPPAGPLVVLLGQDRADKPDD